MLELITMAVFVRECCWSRIPFLIMHDQRKDTGKPWRRQHEVHGDENFSMSLWLTQQDQHRVEAILLDVPHPNSVNYGQHLTSQQVAEMFAPH